MRSSMGERAPTIVRTGEHLIAEKSRGKSCILLQAFRAARAAFPLNAA